MRPISHFLVATIIVRCAATHPQEFVHPKDPRAALESRFATPNGLVERAGSWLHSASSSSSSSSDSIDSDTGVRRPRYHPVKTINRGDSSGGSILLTSRDGPIQLFIWTPNSVTGAVVEKWAIAPSVAGEIEAITMEAARKARGPGKFTHVALVCEMRRLGVDANRDIQMILRQDFPIAQKRSIYYPSLSPNRDVDVYYAFTASIDRPGEVIRETRSRSPGSDSG